MKISTILFTLTVSGFILVVLGFNFILKSEYEKIDKKDPYFGFTSHSVPSFKYVKLKGHGFALTQISNGAQPEVKMNVDPKMLEWKVDQDTLVVTYHADKGEVRYPVANSFDARPAIYILAPDIRAVSSAYIKSRIKKVRADQFMLSQLGDGVMLTENDLSNFSAVTGQGGVVRVAADNRVGNCELQVKDSSSFESARDVFATFKASVDSTAHLNVPGSILRKMAR